MAEAQAPAVRYSNANVGKSEAAQGFGWEQAIPVNKFWDSLSYCASRNFVMLFSDEEFQQLPIDPDSDASDAEKLKLLLSLIQKQLAKEELAAAPQTLHETDYARWNNLWLGISSMQSELKSPEAEQTMRMMADRRLDRANLSPLHTLADHLVSLGKFEEAEKMERPVCAWMDAHEKLGRDSPQAINARRILAQALWGQGAARRAEAEAVIAEIGEITEGMAGGRFEVYQEEERVLTQKMMDKLPVA